MTYRARPIRFLQHWSPGSWKIKVYGISAWSGLPPEELVKPALALAEQTLPADATADGRHGVGFCGIHDGKNARFMFVSWWGKTYELNHCLFRSPREIVDFQPVEKNLIGCTWDLQIVSFERDAWLASMMGDEAGTPNLERYLAATFNADT